MGRKRKWIRKWFFPWSFFLYKRWQGSGLWRVQAETMLNLRISMALASLSSNTILIRGCLEFRGISNGSSLRGSSNTLEFYRKKKKRWKKGKWKMNWLTDDSGVPMSRGVSSSRLLQCWTKSLFKEHYSYWKPEKFISFPRKHYLTL